MTSRIGIIVAALMLLAGCVSSQSTVPGEINSNGAAGTSQTVVHEGGMTVQTNDGAPNLLETADFRAQSAVPGSALALVTEERTAAAHSNANITIGNAEWTKYDPATGELLERVTLEGFTTGDRAEIINADNASVVTWAELAAQLSEDQRAVYEEAIADGATVAEAVIKALFPAVPVPVPVDGGDS